VTGESADSPKEGWEEDFGRAYDLAERCHYLSAVRLAQENSRLAREKGEILPFLWNQNAIMGWALHLLDPVVARQAIFSVKELVESEGCARAFQADLPEEEYRGFAAWISPCIHDHLVGVQALVEGENSGGMIESISAGVEVCHEVDKIRCVYCFRSRDIRRFLASGDVEMALHRVRMQREIGPDIAISDQRWHGLIEGAKIHLLYGRSEEALRLCREALEQEEAFDTPLFARIRLRLLTRQVRLFLDQPDLVPGEDALDPESAVPRGEFPRGDLQVDLWKSVSALHEGDHDLAETLLIDWDRRLRDQHCWALWFEVRLRRIAVARIRGDQDSLAPLVDPIERRARSARDWLTRTRLHQLVDPLRPPDPLARVRPLEEEFPGDRIEGLGEESEVQHRSGSLQEETRYWVDRVAEREQEGSMSGFQDFERFLALDPATVVNSQDAVALLGVGEKLFEQLLLLDRATLSESSSETENSVPDPMLAQWRKRSQALWSWGEQLLESFGEDPAVSSRLAGMGWRLGGEPQDPFDPDIPEDRLEQLFGQALERVNPDESVHFLRAGCYYLTRGRVAEAEEAFARGWCLDRTDAFVANELVDCYHQTGRTRDAIQVVELSMQAGCVDWALNWNGVFLAASLEEWELLRGFARSFEEQFPDSRWIPFYQVMVAIGLDQVRENAQEIELALAEEERRLAISLQKADFEPVGEMETSVTLGLRVHLEISRAVVASRLGDLEVYREHLDRVLGVSFADSDSLQFEGVDVLFRFLWESRSVLPGDDSRHIALEDRLLATGMAPQEMFEVIRVRGEIHQSTTFHVVTLKQPLDARWSTSSGCLFGQQDWTHYLATWGVLAPGAEEAVELAMCWQERCFPLAAEVVSVQSYPDSVEEEPGILWQGGHYEESE
jgi:hypothetical protein